MFAEHSSRPNFHTFLQLATTSNFKKTNIPRDFIAILSRKEEIKDRSVSCLLVSRCVLGARHYRALMFQSLSKYSYNISNNCLSQYNSNTLLISSWKNTMFQVYLAKSRNKPVSWNYGFLKKQISQIDDFYR